MKIFSVIVFIGVMVFVGVWYVILQMCGIDDVYFFFLEKDVKSFSIMLCLNCNIFEFCYIVYRIIVEFDVEDIKEIVVMVGKVYDENVWLLKVIRGLIFVYVVQFDIIGGEIVKMQKVMQVIVEVVFVGYKDWVFDVVCSQMCLVFVKVLVDMCSLCDIMDQVIQKGFNDLIDIINVMICMIWMVMVLILVFVCVLVFFIVWYGIIVLICMVVELLQKFVNGDYSVVVVGIECKDEVGDIVKVVVVFRENGFVKICMEQE